jgi:cytochrome c-type biogenesis protein CcmH/NrfG
VAELGSIAEHLAREGDLVLMLRISRRMVRVGPEDAYAWGMLGLCLCKLEQRKQGREAFAKATWFAGANPNARLRVAQCLRSAGFDRQATEQAYLAFRLDRCNVAGSECVTASP